MRIENLIKLIEQSSILAVDTETTGLNTRIALITDLVIAGEAWSICLPIRSWDGQQLVELVSAAEITPILQLLTTKKLVMHNAAYDIKVIKSNYSVDLSDALYADTLLMAHTVDENKQSYALKTLAVELLGHGADDEKNELAEHLKTIGAGKSFYKADSSIRAKYAEKDGRLTYDLFVILDAELRKQRLESFFYDDEVMPLLKNVTIPMESRGIKIDMEKLNKLQLEITKDIETIEDRIQTAISPYLEDFNRWFINKEYPVKFSGEFLDELMKLMAPESWPKTKSGSYSLSATEVCKAKKKGLIPSITLVESYIGVFSDGQKSEPMERLPENVVKNIQRMLMLKSGIKYPFNLKSKDHLKRLFFGYGQTKSVLRENPINSTDKGSPQVDEEFLELMAKKYSWAADLITYNKLNKISSTYYQRFLDEQENGIFYPTFFQHRTVSGRYSGDLQQLPRAIENPQPGDLVAKYTNSIRELFISRDGYIFIDNDYNSAEPRCFSHVSNEQAIKDIFNNDLDFYSEICIRTESLDRNLYSADKKSPNYLGKKDKAKRQMAKSYSLGLAYFMTPFKLQYEIGVHIKQAEKLRNDYFKAFPNLKSWFDSTLHKVCTEGRIVTEAGRVRRYPEIPELYAKYGSASLDQLELWKQYHENPADYAKAKFAAARIKEACGNGLNIQNQGLTASIINRASIALAKYFKEHNLDAHIVMSVHDELVFECNINILDQVAPITQQLMEGTYKISIDMPAIPSIGYTYAEAKNETNTWKPKKVAI